MSATGHSEPQQTLGFRRVLQRAALHVQSAGKDQISGRDVLVSMFRETDSHAVFLLERQGIARLDVVSYISHGVSKIGAPDDADADDGDDERPGDSRRPGRKALELFAVNLNQRAAEGDIDPLIGREDEIDPCASAVSALAERLVSENGASTTLTSSATPGTPNSSNR